ncbi:cytochrome c oxidase subunit II [Methylocystis bryophila]|uniref:cytochrome-c oxidase n=1 Tax=Methylocystis bryophila TaxID=655015 RepID=A0A1W6MSE4_9HYPH|nr:cytochrome c oxidase subunit II [Methylocystis bryophila]ARN80531.1 cytochrome-c oxidase [Methylocystis bryophila]BDV40577.1 cytochrome-c oxidase [Methylocystis bryophila]
MAVALVMVLVVAVSLLFHVVSPWRSTPIASNWGFIDGTLGLTFAVTTAGFVAVVLFMAYCLYRSQHTEGRRAEYEPENQKLEAWLGGLTTLGVIALLAPGLVVWDQFIHAPKEATEIEAFGVQWNWSFRLPGADGKLGSSDVRYIDGDNPLGVSPADPKSMDDIIVVNGELHLPVDKPVKVLLRSADVLHDFYIPQIRAKMDLVPGMVSYLWFTPTKVGEYDILCAAYCGIGHPQMRGKLFIDTQADYEKWLSSQQTFLEMRKAQRQSRHEARSQ